jgi:hypothetical protein
MYNIQAVKMCVNRGEEVRPQQARFEGVCLQIERDVALRRGPGDAVASLVMAELVGYVKVTSPGAAHRIEADRYWVPR